MSEKIIDDVMALAEEAIYCAATAQLCEFDGDHEGFIRYQGCSNNAYKAIRAKLREVLERKPLTDEQKELLIAAWNRRAPVRLEAQQAAVQCWKVSEEMHVAAVKVLQRANGLDGLPQRMLDAMLAASPTPPAQECKP